MTDKSTILTGSEPDKNEKTDTTGRHLLEFDLKGLNCSKCAMKIEKSIRMLEGVESASIMFAIQKMKIEISKPEDAERITRQARKISGDLERGMKLREVRPVSVRKPMDERIAGKEDQKQRITDLVRFPVGLLLLLAALLWKGTESTRIILYLTSYLCIGGDVLFSAVRDLFRGRVFDEKFLMSVATAGALAIREFPEAVSVMLFYQIGEFVQESALRKSRKSISSLVGIRADYANVLQEGELVKVSPSEVHTGETIWVRPGERVPLDGHILSGEANMDMSALTGESLPREVRTGDTVLSGSINLNGMLEIMTEKEFGESTVSKILEIVENANSRKAPIENFITKFSKVYTPIVVGTALLLALVPPLVVPDARFADWIYRALVFLVVSCPCALMISIPLGFFGGIGGASKNGILVKGGNYLEALDNVDTVVFDKTGTLTKGVFSVTKIVCATRENDAEAILKYAAAAEVHSNHPIAQSIRKAYEQLIEGKRAGPSAVIGDGQDEADANTCDASASCRIADVLGDTMEIYEEISGSGVRILTQSGEILVGNTRMMKEQKIEMPEEALEEMGTLLHVVRNREYLGYLLISDEVKDDAKETIEGLKAHGVERIVMLTGDRESVAESIARSLSIKEFYAGLLPAQKVETLEKIESEKKTKGALLFVGDGINDAPVLARSDVGFAMGGVGSDAAIEAADVVIMTDEPSKVVHAIRIAKRTKTIVWQNIILALAVKGGVLLLGAFGVATMWEAVFADVGVAVIAVLNSTRAMK